MENMKRYCSIYGVISEIEEGETYEALNYGIFETRLEAAEHAKQWFKCHAEFARVDLASARQKFKLACQALTDFCKAENLKI